MPKGIYIRKIPVSLETKRKMSLTHLKLHSGKRLPKLKKGQKPEWCFTKEAIEKRSIVMKLRFTDKTKHPRWRGGKPKCKDCKKQLTGHYQIRCFACHKKYCHGKNSPTWKGGITSSNKRDRIRFRKYIQKQVFERDNYTCQLCGVRGDLQVDHIQSWKDYVELRFDINNCRTLCARCHYRITFGREMPNSTKVWGHNLKHILRKGVD